ncbi:MAG: hypothetical protein PHE51_10075 [Eubacteriales bacterium]|nr:hypothetical protein [Eubacteriales bacterium]
MQLLSKKKNNWRLYWNRQKELVEGTEQSGELHEQWSADFVPQSWQNDVIADELLSTELFEDRLRELGYNDVEIRDIVYEDE